MKSSFCFLAMVVVAAHASSETAKWGEMTFSLSDLVESTLDEKSVQQTKSFDELLSAALHGPGPVLHSAGPVLHSPGPVLHGPGPVLHGPGPVLHGPGPVLHGPGPVASGGPQFDAYTLIGNNMRCTQKNEVNRRSHGGKYAFWLKSSEFVNTADGKLEACSAKCDAREDCKAIKMTPVGSKLLCILCANAHDMKEVKGWQAYAKPTGPKYRLIGDNMRCTQKNEVNRRSHGGKYAFWLKSSEFVNTADGKLAACSAKCDAREDCKAIKMAPVGSKLLCILCANTHDMKEVKGWQAWAKPTGSLEPVPVAAASKPVSASYTKFKDVYSGLDHFQNFCSKDFAEAGACAKKCDADAKCIGFQHKAKHPCGGQCMLASKVWKQAGWQAQAGTDWYEKKSNQDPACTCKPGEYVSREVLQGQAVYKCPLMEHVKSWAECTAAGKACTHMKKVKASCIVSLGGKL